MYETAFIELVDRIREQDPRYDREAYFFVRESLDFTSKSLKKPDEGPERHISGRELLEGIKQHALQRFGPIALTVLNEWGVTSTEDFGQLVFNLVEAGSLGKTDEDTPEDFAGGYDFHDAFEQPFLPRDETDKEDTDGRKAPPRK